MSIESDFTLNHLFTQSNASTILVWKSFGLGLFTIILVSPANNIGILLSFMVLGKSLMYIRNNSGPRPNLGETHQLFFPMWKNLFDSIFHL